jgi:hypothetical protein
MGTCTCCQGILGVIFSCLDFTIGRQGEKRQIFAHPAVKSLLLEYFFSGRNSDAYYDLDAFGPAIPLPTIALVITVVSIHLITFQFIPLILVQLKVCLDEWADGTGNNLDFSMGVYNKIYVKALGFLKKANEDSKYKDHMESLRINWFRMGKSVVYSQLLNKLTP